MIISEIIKKVIKHDNDVVNLNEQLEHKANESDVRKRNVSIVMEDLSTEVKQAMTGGSVAVVGENSVGQENLKSYSVSNKALDLNLINDFNGYEVYARSAGKNDGLNVDTVFDLSTIKNTALTTDKWNVEFELFSDEENLDNADLYVKIFLNDIATAGSVSGTYISTGSPIKISKNVHMSISYAKGNYSATEFNYAHVIIVPIQKDKTLFSKYYFKNIRCKLGETYLNRVGECAFYNQDSLSILKSIKQYDNQVITSKTLKTFLDDNKYINYNEKTIFKNSLESELLIRYKNVFNKAVLTTSDPNNYLYINYLFDINSIQGSISPLDKYKVSYSFYSESDNITNIKTKIFANNNPDISQIGGGLIEQGALWTEPIVLNELMYYNKETIKVQSQYRYVRICATIEVTDKTIPTEFYMTDVELQIGNNILKPIEIARHNTPGTFETNQYYPQSFVQYKEVKDLINNVTPSKWKGKVWNLEGDSITQINASSTKRYWQYIQEKIGCTCNCYAIGGTGYTDTTATNSPYLPISERFSQMNDDADLITVFAGTNDWALTKKTLGKLGDKTNETFYGALDVTINGLINKYPLKTIALITPIPRESDNGVNSEGKTLQDYVNAIKEVANKYSVPCLDLYSKSNLYPRNATCKTTFIPDGLHPNAEGHKHFTDKVLNFINSL